ncbi:MAG: YhgE/Pip domain-containing protein, partial [Raoultibacter sp.]
AAIAIMPLLYGALYLAAFQDPYARLNTVPVAVVNEDKGAIIAGESRTLGDDVIDELKNNDEGLQWNFVSADEAQKGLDNGTYFMTCTLPADFSESVASVDGNAPEKAQLLIDYNQSENMLASQIGETVWKEVRTKVSSTVANEYWTTVLGRVADSGKDLKTAADGAGDLSRGLVTAKDGSATIASNLGTLTDGATSLDSGLGTLSSGVNTLGSGAVSLASGTHSLKDGTNQVASGAHALADATASLPDESQVAQLGSASDRLKGGFDQLQAGIGTASDVPTGDPASTTLYGAANGIAAGVGSSSDTAASRTLYGFLNSEKQAYDAAYQAAVAGDTAAAQQYFATAQEMSQYAQAAAAQLSGGAAGLQSGIGVLQTGLSSAQAGYTQLSDLVAPLVTNAPTLKVSIDSLAAGAQQVNVGAQSAAAGASQLSAGASQLVAGATAAKAGASQVADGAGQLSAGATTLTDGLTSAVDGSAELATKLAEGAQTATDQTSNLTAKADTMSDPVELVNEYYTTVKNYGTGFAPYFMALGLWVGGLVAGFVFKPLNSRLIMSGGNPAMVAFANFMPIAIFAIIQATLLMVVLQFGLQLQIDNVPAFYAMGYLTALVFATIMQFLMAALGFPGKFVAIILLMLQLTACAGTFPIQTTPAFFQTISPFMPMTYVVEGMRQIMTGLDYSLVFFDCAVLLAIGVVCFALTSVVAYRKRTVRMEDLHPVLQLG